MAGSRMPNLAIINQHLHSRDEKVFIHTYTWKYFFYPCNCRVCAENESVTRRARVRQSPFFSFLLSFSSFLQAFFISIFSSPNSWLTFLPCFEFGWFKTEILAVKLIVEYKKHRQCFFGSIVKSKSNPSNIIEGCHSELEEGMNT